MFTDMVDSTALTQEDEGRALALRTEQAEILRPIFVAHQGREIKSLGDGFLVEFDSALRAMECALEIQRSVHQRNLATGTTPIRLRIGIHLGDVEPQGRDIFGDAVNIASRIQTAAEPGGICLSSAVYEQVWNKVSDKLERLPPTQFKGLREPMSLYRVVLPSIASPVVRDTSRPPRVAVLPLTNISPNPKDAYFAEGLTEELIGALSKIRNLRVVARTSVGQYRSTSKTVAQIGTELGVTSLLEGSVRKAGNQLRVSLQLIDVGTQDHMWAQTFDRRLDDVFAIQTEIAERTAGALQVELLASEHESIIKPPTKNLAAYEFYLKGIQAASQAPRETVFESIQNFEDAIRADRGFAQAYALLANVLISLAWDTLPPDEPLPRIRELIAKALELNSKSPEARMARGNLALQYEQDYELAEAEFLRAIAINPSYSDAHYWYSILLRVLGRFGDATREAMTAIELAPLWEPPRTSLRALQLLTGHIDDAITSVEDRLRKHPEEDFRHVVLGRLYADAGRTKDARREAALAAKAANRGSVRAKLNLAQLWAQVGRPEEARRLLRLVERAAPRVYFNRQWIAGVYATLGERDKAFEWLERDHREGARGFYLTYQSRTFASIRNDPRFLSILKELKIPNDPKRFGVEHSAS